MYGSRGLSHGAADAVDIKKAGSLVYLCSPGLAGESFGRRVCARIEATNLGSRLASTSCAK